MTAFLPKINFFFITIIGFTKFIYSLFFVFFLCLYHRSRITQKVKYFLLYFRDQRKVCNSEEMLLQVDGESVRSQVPAQATKGQRRPSGNHRWNPHAGNVSRSSQHRRSSRSLWNSPRNHHRNRIVSCVFRHLGRTKTAGFWEVGGEGRRRCSVHSGLSWEQSKWSLIYYGRNEICIFETWFSWY